MTMFETGYTIQAARRDDLPGVVACLAAAFEPYRASYTPGAFDDTVPTVEACERRLKEMTILVAKEGAGVIIGTIACQRVKPGEGHLRGMAVQPGIEGRGVAKNLLAAAEAELRALDCTRVSLDTTEPLGRAIRFYEEHGYAPTGTVADFFGMPLFEYAKNL
jgi:GNAT superfamily N-acetyltransferase